VSDLNAEIMERLPKSTYLVHNEMQELEHSLELFLFYIAKNKQLKLYQYWCLINYETIDGISTALWSGLKN
jgi:hypothetical protein